MLVVGLNPQTLTEEEVKVFTDDLILFFKEGDGIGVPVTSLYYQEMKKKDQNQKRDLVHHLCGETHIIDRILGLNFRISPEAFFQVNTAAAEVLYSTAIELSAVTPETTVLDICCGTGTIGLCFAKVSRVEFRFKRVDCITGCQNILGLLCCFVCAKSECDSFNRITPSPK